MTKNLSAIYVFSLMIILGNLGLAQSSPSFVFLSWDSTASLIKSQLSSTLTATHDITNFTTTVAGIPITIPDISMAASVPVTMQQNGAITNLSGAPLQIDVKVSDFSIAANLDKVVNGVTIHVNINAQCTGPQVSLKNGSVSTNVQWQILNNFVSLNVSDVELNWQTTDWAVTGFQCQGLGGLDAVTQNLIQSALADPQIFAPALKSILQAQIQQKVAGVQQSLSNLLQKQELGVSVYYQFLGVAALNNYGLVFQIELGLDPSTLASAPIGASFLSSVDYTQLASPTWMLQSADLQNLLTTLFSKGQYTLPMNKVSYFEKLMDSWLGKLFLWPDLLNFAKDTPFNLMSQVVNNNVSLKLTGASSLTLQTEVGSWLMAERDAKNWPYIYADSQLSGTGNFVIANSLLSVTFTKPQLKQKFTFGPDYVKRYSPLQSFPSSIVQSAVTQQLESQALSFALPQLSLPAAVSATPLTIESVSSSNGVFYFHFNPLVTP